MKPPTAAVLPAGVTLRPLPGHRDATGHGIDLLQRDWDVGLEPVQWNYVTSQPDTLRGVHVHASHSDYLCVLVGEMLLGLHDMRPWSSTYRMSVLQPLRGDTPGAIMIPPGVAHGFYVGVAAEYVYAVSHYWDPADELGCLWSDPDLNLAWPTAQPMLSPRDSGAPSYAALAQSLAKAMARDPHGS